MSLLHIYIATSRLAQSIANNTVGTQHLPQKEIIQWVQHDYNFRQKGYTGLSSLWQNELMHSGKLHSYPSTSQVKRIKYL